ncbi:MAG: hypothetical protein H7X95_09150 [Deltaproteobacteria bacterium]|nr:hypothetical protein [Deltaproteobacteria bacterium]
MLKSTSQFFVLSSLCAVGVVACTGQRAHPADGGVDRRADGVTVDAARDGQGTGGAATGGAGTGGAGTGGAAGGVVTGGTGGTAGRGTGGDGGRGTTGGAGGSGGRGGSQTGGQAGGLGGAGGQGSDVCSWSATYRVVDAGGFVAMVDTATLTPPNSFRYDRQSFVSDAGQPTCAPALPACSDPTRIDVSDIERAIAHADVQRAFALFSPPFYGDRGIADGPSISVLRPGPRGFSAGIPCNVPSATCVPIPAGVATLVAQLRALIRQQTADPTCAAFQR